MLPWQLRLVLGGNRSESGIIMMYSASEQGYLLLALYKHALLLIKLTFVVARYLKSLSWNIRDTFISDAEDNHFTINRPYNLSFIKTNWNN